MTLGQIPQRQWSYFPLDQGNNDRAHWVWGWLRLQRHAQCGELSVALSLIHQLLVSMLMKPHVLSAIFFSEHLVSP